ncbi:hypothetical protein [Enterococcus nangangensis]|nr:hypothetical protein [Enterococcus nangangensis]
MKMQMVVTSIVTVLGVASLAGLLLVGLKAAQTKPEPIRVPVERNRR